MGDPRAVNEEMAAAITSTAERVWSKREDKTSRSQSNKREDKTSQFLPPEVESIFASQMDDISVEVVINLADIDLDALEKQPEMAFGNLVKRRAEVKISTLTPQRKKELLRAKDKSLNT